MCCGNMIKKYVTSIIRVSHWIFLGICLAGFIMQGYDCIQTYLSCPQSIEIDIKPQKDLDFPEITFCPRNTYLVNDAHPMAYDSQALKNCGLSKWTHSFFNESYTNCTSAKNIWENVTPKLADFGFISATVGYYDWTEAYLDIKEDNLHWKRTLSINHGACYTLTLPNTTTEKSIQNLYFELEANKSLELFVHSRGLLNPADPYSSIDVDGKIIHPNLNYDFMVNYEQRVSIDLPHERCNLDKDYDYGICKENEVYTVSILKFFFSSEAYF